MRLIRCSCVLSGFKLIYNRFFVGKKWILVMRCTIIVQKNCCQFIFGFAHQCGPATLILPLKFEM